MLATIISKYLQENRRLVIPQLGAFLVKEPGRTVLFSQLLTKDDGVLQNLLVESGMSDVEASGAISRLLFDVRFIAENGGQYWLSGIGYFSKGKAGTLHFEFDPQTTPQAIYSTESAEEKKEERDETTEEATTPEEPKIETIEEKIEEAEEVAQEQVTQEQVVQKETQKETKEELPPPLDTDTTQGEPQTTQERPQNRPAKQIAEQPEGLEAAPEEYRHIHFEPDPDLEGLSYEGNGKRSKRRASTPSSKKLDWWMIIAITSAILAISVILYGFLREGAQHGSPIAARLEQSAK